MLEQVDIVPRRASIEQRSRCSRSIRFGSPTRTCGSFSPTFRQPTFCRRHPLELQTAPPMHR